MIKDAIIIIVEQLRTLVAKYVARARFPYERQKIPQKNNHVKKEIIHKIVKKKNSIVCQLRDNTIKKQWSHVIT